MLATIKFTIQSTTLFLTGAVTADVLIGNLDWFTILVTMVSGGCGGLIRVFYDQARIWPAGVITMVSGALTAVFLWPIGAPLMEMMTGRLAMPPINKVMLGGFIIGLLGMGIIGMFLDFMRLRRSALKGDKDDS